MNKEITKDITPETRISQLLKNYPELEEEIIRLAPAFKKLRNPFLRRTVAKVTTLRQAARIGDISVGYMINTLRKAAGLEELQIEKESAQAGEKPAWVKDEQVARTLDARPLIENGEHPVEIVIRELEDLEEGKLYRLITPFLPAPLIDIARNKGFEAFTEAQEKERFVTYFRRKEAR